MYNYNSCTAVPFMWGSLRLTPVTSISSMMAVVHVAMALYNAWLLHVGDVSESVIRGLVQKHGIYMRFRDLRFSL